MQTQRKKLKRSRLSGSSPMMEVTVSMRQRMLGKLMGAAQKGTKNVDMKEEDKVMKLVDVTEQEASSELGPQVVQEMRMVRKVMYYVCLFHNIDFRWLADEHDFMHTVNLLGSKALVLSDGPCNVRSGREIAKYQYELLIIKSMENAVALCKLAMGPKALGYLFSLHYRLRSGKDPVRSKAEQER